MRLAPTSTPPAEVRRALLTLLRTTYPSDLSSGSRSALGLHGVLVERFARFAVAPTPCITIWRHPLGCQVARRESESKQR